MGAVKVNAAEAARLAGVSERTMRTWLAAGRIAGAEKMQRPGHPAAWEIDPAQLPQRETPAREGGELAVRVAALEQEVRALRTHLGIPAPGPLPTHAPPAEHSRDTISSVPVALPPYTGPDSALNASLVQPRDLPADWELLTDVAERHGISPRSAASQRKAAAPPFPVHAQRAGTKQFWYLDTEGKRAAISYWASIVYRPRPGTHVHRCDGFPGCPCHELLPDA